MLKKFLFISIVSCLFFKPIDVFSADYDADDTEIMMNDENPFADTRFCGFEKFKEWCSLKDNQRKKIDEKNEKKFKNALALYLNYKFKNEPTFDEALKLSAEGAQNACPKSMELLGTLKVEKGDNAPEEEKQKYYNDAFSWYVIAFWTQIIKEIKLNQTITIPKTIVSRLENLSKKTGFSEERINYFEFIAKNILFFKSSVESSSKGEFYSRFIYVLQHLCANMIRNFFPDRKLSVFTFNVFNWGITCAKIKKQSALYLNDLGSLFYNNGFLYECACCYRNPIDQDQITILSKLIFEGHINVDQYGLKFNEQDRNKIASSLLWKINSIETKEAIIDLIVNDSIKFDSNGNKITKKNKYNIILKLCLELKTPFSFYKIGNFINSGDISFINGKQILEDEKYDIAADFYRKGKDLPESLYNLGAFIERNKIKKDLYGQDIPEDKKFEVVADLYRHAASEPLALYRLGVFISKGYINKDVNGKLIPKNKRYEVAADLYRRSPSVPSSLGNLASLIQRGIIKKDLFGVDILDSQKDRVAADLYRRSKSTEESLCNLAVLIENDLIDRDLDNKIIDPNQKYEIVADLYRKSKISYALQRLAILIYENKTSTDLDNNPIILDFQRNEVVVDLLLQCDSPEANYHIALVKLSSSLGNSFEVRKEALEFLMKAALGGFTAASFYYVILENEIESEKYSLNVSGQDQSIVDQKPLEIKIENLSSGDDVGDEEDSSHGEDDDFSKIDVSGAVDTIETQKFSDDKNLCDAKEQKDLSANEQLEELSLLKRRELKALKKRQREQNKKEQNYKFKKLIRGQLSEEEKKSLMSKPDTNFHKENVYVLFDKNAQDQWIGLNAFERNKVSALIADIKISGKRGKPEKLKGHELFSRRITDKHRLVYKIINNGNVNILSCQGHYDD
ncbi:MAG: type II toxin-antitoxin system YoeB family toxin [Alphaproteobacteria bacterium]|nr:type II toxin-antitoxin system YoeB family toxin [Alphaproteobacteria bacterium]